MTTTYDALGLDTLTTHGLDLEHACRLRTVRTVADVVYNANAAGSFFFSPDAMRAWGSRIHRTYYGAGVFTTSERGALDRRVYSVRRYRHELVEYTARDYRDRVEIVDEVLYLPTLAMARRAARLVADGVHPKVAERVARTGARSIEAVAVEVALEMAAA